MHGDRSLRQRLQATVLEASTPAGRAYNVVIFGAILLSVLALLVEPDPLGHSALRQMNVPWIDLVQNVCLVVFAANFVLHLALVERPRRYLFSFTGLIDASAVPRGILTLSGVGHHQQRSAELVCSSCGRQGHRRDSRHCDSCGASLPSSV